MHVFIVGRGFRFRFVSFRFVSFRVPASVCCNFMQTSVYSSRSLAAGQQKKTSLLST